MKTIYTKKDIIKAIKDFVEKYKVIPYFNIWKKLELKPSYTVIVNNFGNFKNAIGRAGFNYNKKEIRKSVEYFEYMYYKRPEILEREMSIYRNHHAKQEKIF